jgi:hypothetical protein
VDTITEWAFRAPRLAFAPLANMFLSGRLRMARMRYLGILALATALVPTSFAASDGNGLSGRLIVGYQGWFGCPGDFQNNAGWQHWFLKSPQAENLTVDLLPSVRTMDKKDLCDTGMKRPDGSPIYLFSSQSANVVSTHFRWMEEHGIDGAAVQRFISETLDPRLRDRRDNVLRNVMAAAAEHGRKFYIVYDISGGNPQTVMNDIRKDWRHLVDDLKMTSSPSYLQDHGKPVLELWGFGFSDRPGGPEEVAALISDLKSGRNGVAAATLIGGVPTNWRTLSGDSKPDAAWAAVFRSYDVISPWAVGRFSNASGADSFIREHVQPDLVETRRLGLGYMPVVFPGFSWSNLMNIRGQQNQAVLNKIPRDCGRFLWRQVSNLMQSGVDMMYAAMFDEADEGTALFPAETRADKLPVGSKMLYLNQDGCSLPDDWYLRVTGKAAEYVHSGKVPPPQLEKVIQP